MEEKIEINTNSVKEEIKNIKTFGDLYEHVASVLEKNRTRNLNKEII